MLGRVRFILWSTHAAMSEASHVLLSVSVLCCLVHTHFYASSGSLALLVACMPFFNAFTGMGDSHVDLSLVDLSSARLFLSPVINFLLGR